MLTDVEPASSFAEADAVFRGTVLEFSEPYVWREEAQWVPDLVQQGLRGHPDRISALIEVEEAWKGVETRQVRVWAYIDQCGAGMTRLEPGEQVLVFAFDVDGVLVTNGSYRPEPVDSDWAREALAQFGPGETDLREGDRSPLADREWLGLAALTSVLVTARWLLWWRRKERAQVGRAID